MMFEWGKFFQLAEELSDRNGEEYKRTAISRAYYSAFHHAKNFLEKKGLFYNNREMSVHMLVWQRFEKLGREYRKIYIKGDRLKEKRTKADYEKEIDNIDKLTQNALREANDIIEQISKLVDS